MEAFLIIVAVIVSILFLLVDLYLLAHFAHKEQPNTSPVNIFCKILIVLTLLQTQFQPFFLIIDVANSRSSNDDLTTFWLILYISLMANLAVLKPIATSLYERDHDESCLKSVVWIIVEIVISLFVVGLFLIIGWTFWGTIKYYAESVTIDSANFGVVQSASNSVSLPVYFQFQTTIVCFFIGFFCLLGYPILACCGACGLTVMPISLILDFVNRPTFRRTADAKKVSEFLKVETVRLLREHQKMMRQASRTDEAEGLGFFERRKVNNKYEKELKEMEEQVELQRDYYELFKMELEMEKVNPVIYWLKLLGGVVSILMSGMLWTQILLSQLIFPSSSGHGSVFLDQFLVYLQTQNANFIAVAFISIISFYLTCCIIKGSVFFSKSIPLLVIHPIVAGKTWLNSFLFHLALCSLSAASLIHMLSQTFPYYLRGGNIVVVLDELLANMQVVGWVLSKKIFTYTFLSIGGIGVLYVSWRLLFESENKGELLKRIQAKRMKLFGKDGEGRSAKYIEMVEMNHKDRGKKDK